MQTSYPISKPARSASPAAFEVVSLQEAKDQVRVAESNAEFDPMLLEYITTAREQVERDGLLVAATGTYTIKRTTWGKYDWLELPSSLRPVTSITSITYVDTSGATVTFSSSQYSLDTYAITPIVKLGHGYVWPAIQSDINGITITAVAGYASAAAVPKRIKEAVRLHISQAWHTFLGEMKEADAAQKAYERVVNLLRQEIYA